MKHPAGTDLDLPSRTLAVWCRDWPVVAAGVHPDEAAAVICANRVVATSPAARAEGVLVGIRRREAQGRCPQLRVLERDEAGDVRAFELVAGALEAFVPRLEITEPGTAFILTRGPSRYFGGDEVLAARVTAAVDEALAERGRCRVGIAEGAFAALAAARRARPGSPVVVPAGGAPDFLAPLPVSLLDRADLTDVLSRLGLRTLGALAALSRADVMGRFGAEGVVAHRLASGLDERPPNLCRPPLDLVVTTELDPPVERVDQAAFVAKVLADQLIERLGGQGLACHRLLIEAETAHGERLARLWRYEGALSAGAIADRVRWQLDGWLSGTLAAGERDSEAWSRRPTGAVSRLTLHPDQVGPATGRQLGFWGGDAAADERVVRALARVAGLIGPDAVRVPEHRGGRGPGEQLRLIPAAAVDLTIGRTAAVSEDPTTPWPGRIPGPGPALVHPTAVPVELTGVDGCSLEVSGRAVLSAAPARLAVGGGQPVEVTAWAGPWPADERWWDPASRRRRARVQVVTAAGDAYLLMRESGRWSIEATY